MSAIKELLVWLLTSTMLVFGGITAIVIMALPWAVGVFLALGAAKFAGIL